MKNNVAPDHMIESGQKQEEASWLFYGSRTENSPTKSSVFSPPCQLLISLTCFSSVLQLSASELSTEPSEDYSSHKGYQGVFTQQHKAWSKYIWTLSSISMVNESGVLLLADPAPSDNVIGLVLYSLTCALTALYPHLPAKSILHIYTSPDLSLISLNMRNECKPAGTGSRQKHLVTRERSFRKINNYPEWKTHLKRFPKRP